MKNLCVILVLAACGGKAQPAPPVENKEHAVDIEQKTVAEARVIQRTNNGGVIELAGDRDNAMKAAMDEMSAHCGPDAYTIVQEGEEAVGHDGGPRTATAWRVHYQCNH